MSSAAVQEGSSLSGEDVLILLGGRRESQQRWPRNRRYELDLEVQRSPWLGLADLAVRRLYPLVEGEAVPVLLAAHCKAFAESTTNSYLGVFREFAEFCDTHEPELDCLPTTAEVVHLFLVHKVRKLATGSSSLPIMVSAINAVHNLCGFSPPVQEDAHHKLFMAGLGRIIGDTESRPPRGPFLPVYVVDLVAGAATAELVKQGDIVCVMLGLLLGLRGSALGSMLSGDVILGEPGMIRVRATVLKRALQPRAFADWVICFDVQDRFWSSLVGLLAAFKVHVESRGGSSQQSVALFSVLPGSGEALVDQAVQRVLALNPGLPAEVQATLSSHSLRIGACSCMLAIGVPRDTIRLWFKWKSNDMIDTYARVVQPESWMERLFGWMKAPGAPVAMVA